MSKNNVRPGLREKASQYLQRYRQKGIIKIISFSLLVVVVIGYNILFTPAILEKIVKSQFEKSTNGIINLDIKKSSLFRGFSIENIEILSGEDFSRRPVVKIDKLNIFYSIYGFFAGDFGLHEIGIYNPRITLYHRDDVWNISTLFKPGADKPEKPPEEEDEGKEPSDAINLPVGIRGFIKFILNDFNLTITDLNPGGGDTLEAGLKNFTLRTYVITNKFSRIPLNLGAFDILKSVVVHLDPEKTIDIYYRNSSSRLKSPLDFHWLLTFDEKIKKEGFYSKLEIGHHNVPVEYKGKHLLPLNFGIDYDIKYDPSGDLLFFDFFRLSFAHDIWLNLTGKVLNLSDPEKMNLDIGLNKSNIVTDKLYPYYKALMESDDLTFRGTISLAPLKISGPLNKLILDGKISLNKLVVHMKDKNFDIAHFDLFYKSEIDKNLNEGLIPKVRNLQLKWNGVMNNARLGAEILYSLKERINLYTYIHNLDVEPFSGDSVSGIFDIDLRVKGPNEKNLTSTLDVKSDRFTYYVGRGVSGINKLGLNVAADILFPGEGFGTIDANVKTIDFRLNNEKNQKGVALLATVDADVQPEEMQIQFNLKNLAANLKNLRTMVPVSYREKIENLAEDSEKDIRLNGRTTYVSKNESILAENTTNIFIDDLDINDVIFKTKVLKTANQISIPHMTLNGLNNALSAQVDGKLTNQYRKTEYNIDGKKEIRNERTWIPDLKYSLKLGQEEKKRIFKSYSIAGLLDLTGILRDNIINGNFNIDRMYFDNGNFTRVNNINLDFPFEHDRRFRKTLNLTAANKERIIKTFDEDFKFNFTIDSVEIPNPTRQREPMKIIYPGGGFSGLSAAMRYRDNVFEMPMMQIFLLNGLATVQDTVFNVGTGSSKEMEYRSLVQIKDIDFKQLIPAEKAASITDGKISADALLTASSMENMLANTNGYVSIYKIGKQFARQGVKIVMPESSPLVTFIVDEWTIIHKFDIELKEGLAYAKILYSKGTLGNLIGLEGNEIVQERRPIAEIWQKAGEEVKIYQSDNVSTPAMAQ